MSKHAAPATARTLHKEAYAAGEAHRNKGGYQPEDHSGDWSIQHEYENGFYGRPYWY